MAMGETFSAMKQSLRMTPISTSNAAEDETPLPLGTLEEMYTSRPESLAPRWRKASHSPRSRAMVVFSSSLRAARFERSMTHRSYPSLWTRSWFRLLGAAAAIISMLTLPASTRPCWWSVWLPPISVRPGALYSPASVWEPKVVSSPSSTAA